MNRDFWESFREEIVATSLILGLTVVSSFFLASRLFQTEAPAEEPEKTPEQRQEEVAAELEEAMNLVLGETSEAEPSPAAASNDGLSAPLPTPTINPMDTEVVSGQEGQYGFDEYEVELQRPRVAYNLQKADSKRFVVDVTMKNITVTQGLPTTLKAEVVRDGSVMVAEAAMSGTESRVLLPGDEVTFQASLSLIDGSDVSKILYTPQGVEDTIEHVLFPNRQTET